MLKSTIVYSAIIAGLLCLVLFEAFRIRDLNARIAAMRGQPEVMARSTAIGSGGQTALADALDMALKENLKLRHAVAGDQTQTDGIAGRVATLKDMLNRLPEQRIPQLRYATEADWYAAVDGPLETVEDIRGAFARIRAAAEKRFTKILHPALVAYMKANAGAFPKEVGDLQRFLGESIDPALLQHYKIVGANTARVLVGGEWAITQASVVDSEFDFHFVIGSDGWGYGGPSQ
jgi:hypothetical protein